MEQPSNDWKNELKPLAGPRWPIRCGQALTAEEVDLLRDGLWPRDMDDRWVVWLDGNTLRCWRSWTGMCIYEAKVMLAEDGAGILGVLEVLDDNAAYHRASTDAGELERFEGVLSQMHGRSSDSNEMAGISLVQVP